MEQLNSLWASESIWTGFFSICLRILIFLRVVVGCPTWHKLASRLQVLPAEEGEERGLSISRARTWTTSPILVFIFLFLIGWLRKPTWKKLGVSELHQQAYEKRICSGFNCVWGHLFPSPLTVQCGSPAFSPHIRVLPTNCLDHFASLVPAATSSVLFPLQLMPWLCPAVCTVCHLSGHCWHYPGVTGF